MRGIKFPTKKNNLLTRRPMPPTKYTNNGNKMTQKKLSEVLEKHRHWLNGTGGERADLRYADLCDADLCDADLCDADLCDADLRYADLRGANLRGADLRGANLRDADLCGANLRGANLRYADLCDADLCDADLCDANLCGANLCGANLCGAKNIPPYVCAVTNICPDGELIVWKKLANGIVKLRIPANAKRSNATGRKCRAEYAEVIELIGCKAGRSPHNSSFEYRVGDTVRPTEPFCEDRWDACASGIHFFLTRYEAENY